MGGARAPVLCFVLVIFSFLCFFGESTEEVRLVGDLFGTGRLEVLYTQNETVRAPVWGSVCSDKFDSADAEVACTHMGFHGAAKIFTDGTYANSDSSTAIWFTNLDCGGSEASLLHCSMTKDGNTTCTHSQDVGLTCNSLVRIERAENYYTLAPTPEPTSTDLVGTVKIWHGVNGVNRTWTTVPSIDRYNGAVICKHLSQGATEPFSYVSTSNSRDTISSSADLFTCDGTEGLVDECSSSSSPPSSTPSPALWAPIIRCSRSLTLATAVDEATDEPTGRLFRKFALDAAEFSSSIDSNATGLALVKEFVALLPRYRGIRPILTTPSSASSNAAVASLLVGSSEQAFISLLDTLKNGTWTWVGGDQDGELVYDASGAADGSATYTNWKPPAPSTTDSTGCATIGADGEWSAVDCSLNFPSVVVTYPVDTLEALTSHVTCASNGLVLACPASEQYMTVRSVFAGFDETDHIICSSSAVFTPRASASASLPSSSNSCQIGPAAVKAFIESICFESGALSRTCTISDGQLQAFLASQGACGSTEVELSRVYISVNFECTSAGGAGPVARYIHGDSRYHDTNVPTTPVLTRFGSEDWVGDCDGTVLLSAHGTLAWETLNYGDEDAAEVSSSSGASPSFWTGTAASGGQVTQADNTAQSIFMMITPYENDFYEADLLCMDAQVPSTSSSEAPVLTSRLYLDLQNRLCYEGTLNTATNSSTIMPAYNQVEQTMWVDEEAHTQHICGIHTARTGVWEAAALVREGECVRILLIGVRGKGVVASGCGFQSFSLNDVQRMQLLTRYKGLAFRLSIYDQTLSDGELSFLASSDRERCRSLDYHCPKGMEAYGGSVPEGPVDSTGKRLCTPCRSASINGQTTQLQPSCVTCDCIYLMDCRGRGDAENLYAIFTTYGTGGNSKESCYNSAALIISEGPMVAVFVVGGMWIMTFFVYIILPILCGWDMGDINVMSLMMSLPIFDAILYMVDGVYLFYWLEGIDVLEHKRQMPPVTLQKGVTLIVLGAVQMVVCLLITFGHKGLIENHPGRMRYIFWVSRIALVNAAVVFLLHATELMSGQVSKESTLWDQGIDTGIVFDVGKWDALRLLTARLVLGYTGVLCVIYSVNFWYEENTLKRIIRQKETTDMEAYLEIHGYRIRSRQALETFVMGLYGQTKHEKGVSKHTNNLQKLLVQDPLYDAHLAGLVCSFILPSIKTTDHVMTEDELLELERMQRHHHLDMRGNKLEYLQFSLREYKKMRAQDHPLLRETEEGKAESKKDKQAKAEAMRPIQATLSFRRMLSFGEDDYRDSPSVSTISEEEMKEQEEELEQERQEEEARAEEVKQAAEKEASQEAPDTTWACESCTFINTGGADEAFCAICNSARPPAPVEITESAAQLHTILDSIVKDRRDRAGTDAGGGALDGSGEGGGGKKKKKKKKRILKKDERVELKKLKESIKDIQLKKAVTPQPSPPASSPAQSPSSSAPPSVLASTLSLPPSAVPASGGSMEIPIKNINYIYTRTKKSNTDNNGSTNVDDNTLDIDNNNHIDSEGAADAPIPDSDGDEMHVIDIPRNNRSSDWLKKKARDPNQVIVHDEPASHSSHHHSSSDSNNSQKVTQGHLSSHSNDSGFYSTTNATLSASSSPSASPSRAGADAAVTGLDLGDLKMRDHRSCIAGVREQENDADDEVRVVELSVEGYGGSEVEHV